MPDETNLPARTTNRDLETLPFDQALDIYLPNLADALPGSIPLQRFKRVLITAVNQNSDLGRADRRSLFNACVKCAYDGLYPDGREAALVVYKGRVNYLPMIAGIRKRMRNSGEVLSAIAEVVHKADHFRYEKGEDAQIVHRPPPLDEDRGPAIGAYAIIKLTNGEIIREVMGYQEIEHVRAFSRNSSGQDSPWTTSWSEMARKSVMRRASKQAPISSDMERILQRDDEYEQALPPPPAAPTREQFREPATEIPETVANPSDNEEGAHATAEGEAQPPSRVFVLLNFDAEEIEFDDPEEAYHAFVADVQLRAGRKAKAGAWEDNVALFEAFDADGRGALVDEAKALYQELVKPQNRPPSPADSPREASDPTGSAIPPPPEGSPNPKRAETVDPARKPPEAAMRPDPVRPQSSGQMRLDAVDEGGSPSLQVGAVPIRNGQPDYRTWRIVHFDAAARRCKSVVEFAELIGTCNAEIEAHDRLRPQDAGTFEQARAALMRKLEVVT